MRIGIIGAGIGGLSAAAALLDAGFDVQVYEQAHALDEVGAGVQVSPNASRILHRLGLADQLTRTAVKPLAWQQRRWDDGGTLLRTPLAGAVEARFGYPHYHLHRVDLLAVLAGAVPAERIHLGHRVTGLMQHADTVEARFGNGTTVRTDVLVGADGIHSAVRVHLFGPDQPRFTGCVAYRGLIPAERLADLGLEVTAQVWMGPGRHFVHYFVRSGRLVNFVAVVGRDAWTRESWTERGDLAAALAACLTTAAGSGIEAALDRYQRLRIPRTSRLQAMSASNKTRFHLPDGPDQRDRDAQMAAGGTDWSFEAVAPIYGHDAGALDPADGPGRHR
jgi:salicylate hydroxylase